ncbi:Clp protease N-terminal domain-containing protein [Mycolicibacterium stellerae]|uniref:Clp protease N-terminal domain-containing protein n=1 Tax=Mycolicibacterium stellerae TaxID=2358193 RepID=UPI000F0B2BA0|nr:Clp protease N-terminal domain-containing protein [Mycolicibacterium stellerae]
MFERFTVSARRVVVVSQGEARTLKQDHVGPHHLLLGALTAEGGTAGVVLASLGVEPGHVRQWAIEKSGSAEEEPSGHIRFSDDAKRVLEHSLRESLALEHTYIGTEHIVLGLVEEPATEELFAAIAVRADAVRDAIMKRLGTAAGAQPAEP